MLTTTHSRGETLLRPSIKNAKLRGDDCHFAKKPRPQNMRVVSVNNRAPVDGLSDDSKKRPSKEKKKMPVAICGTADGISEELI